MSEFVVIGSKITIAVIRNYLFTKKIDKGDTLVLNPMDYEHLIGDVKESGEAIDIPLNVLGVLLVKDTSGDVPLGKIQIIENDKL
jgi:hypothetical protein